MQTFSLYFYAFLATTVETLILLLLFMIVLEVADSVHFLYRHFLPKTTERSLNDFYYACFCWTMLHITNRITSMATALSVLCVTLLSGMDRKFFALPCLWNTAYRKNDTKTQPCCLHGQTNDTSVPRQKECYHSLR